MIPLRPYQLALIEQARTAMRAGTRRILIQSPTGSGKTLLTAQMLAGAASRGKRAWFCVHRRELLDQSVTAFIESAGLDVGIHAAGYPVHPAAPVQVCSVPSLAKRLLTLTPPDLIVFDECHHLASASWTRIAEACPASTHIGLTATPQRLDGQGLGAHFDALIGGPSTADLIAQGYLSPYTLYAPGTVDLGGVHRLGGDYKKSELAAAMTDSTVVGDAVSTYRQQCPDARALVFAWSIEASERIAASFVAAGISAQHVDGETPRFARYEAMQRFRSGDLRVLCNVDLFGEGLDVPAVDAVFLLRPTQSLGLYLQQVGRGLRVAPGKTGVKIFDHVNNWERHGLPDDPREWSLEGRKKRARESDAPMGRRCDQCFGVSRPGAKVCPYCGVVFAVKAREVEEVAGELRIVDTSVMELRAKRRDLQRHCTTLEHWLELARQLKYKAGWAWHQYQRSKLHRRTA